MDIKLRARLSAYSKIESINGSNSGMSLPLPDDSAAGSVLGVNSNGSYTLFQRVPEQEIQSLFGDITPDSVVTKEDIDELFETETTKHTMVTKEAIDTLFDESANEPTVRAVSYAEIDSLFKKK